MENKSNKKNKRISVSRILPLVILSFIAGNAVGACSCTISPTPINFPVYYPISVKTQYTITKSFSVTCNGGTSALVTIKLNKPTSNCIMTGRDNLTYTLYKSSAKTTNYCTISSPATVTTVGCNNKTKTFSVYGTLNAGQNVKASSPGGNYDYSDLLQFTATGGGGGTPAINNIVLQDTVVQECRLDTTAATVDFGNLQATDKQKQATVGILLACTKHSPTVNMAIGGETSERTMKLDGTQTGLHQIIKYNIYKPDGTTSLLCPALGSGTIFPTVAEGGWAIPYGVFGTSTSAQSIPFCARTVDVSADQPYAGNYSDSVGFTITY